MAERAQVRIQYYAVFREQRGLAEETLVTAATTPAELYAELRARHGFTVAANLVRAAVNGAFAPMNQRVTSGDSIVFIPPVAGG